MIKSRYILVLFLCFISTMVLGQEVHDVSAIESAMLTSGKAWFVLAVISAIFLIIVSYMIRIDRKISLLEKEMKD